MKNSTSAIASGTPLVSRTTFEARARTLLTGLQHSFAAMLEEARCGLVATAAELERALGLDKKLCWQVHRVVNAPNPIAAGFAVPSAVSTRRLVAAARTRGASDQAASRVERAVGEFERFVREHAEDRLDFESMIADWSPSGREQVELLSRRAAFAAMTRLRGSGMTTSLTAAIVHPAADGVSVSRVLLWGYLGLRRLRSTAKLGAGSLWNRGGPEGEAEHTLDNRPIAGPEGVVLPEFCSGPSPGFEIIRNETGLLQFWIGGHEVGSRTTGDYVFATRRDRYITRQATPERPTMINFLIPSTPARRLIFDCIVHESLFPPRGPQVMVHEVAGNGPVGTHAEFARRTSDLLEWRPPARFMGQGLDQCGAAWAPRYVEMLQHVCAVTGWDPAAFRGHRVEVEYPVHSWQISMAFEKHEASGAAGRGGGCC